MFTYVTLITWTDQGNKDMKASVARSEGARQAIEQALVHAYRREYGPQDVIVRVEPTSGEPRLFELRTVTRFNVGRPDTIPLAAAKLIKADVREGDRIERPVEMPPAFGRVAAQTVKQVVLQKMKEAEREHTFEEFSNQELELVTGVVLRVEGRSVYVSLGKSEAVLPASEQIGDEVFKPGQHVKCLLLEVHRSAKGPQLFLSRTPRAFLKRLLEMEVPEVLDGSVDVKSIAREPSPGRYHRSPWATLYPSGWWFSSLD